MTIDQPIYPCMCDMADDCTRECEMQYERENAEPYVAAERARLEPELSRLRKERDDAFNDVEAAFQDGYDAGESEGVEAERTSILRLIETRRDAEHNQGKWTVLHELRAAIIRGEHRGVDE